MDIYERLLHANGLDVAMKVEELKKELAETNDLIIKHFEGLISDEDYAPIKARREELREKIAELENEVPPC